MKRSELKVGDHLFHAGPGDWGRNSTWRGPQHHVVVLATTPHRRSLYGRNEIHETDSGGGVLVAGVKDDGTHGYRQVVQLAHLRGPYEQILAEVKARQQADRERSEREMAARDAFTAYRAAAVERARAAGLVTAREDSNLTGTTDLRNARVSVGAAELTALLDRLAALEVEQPTA